MLVLRRSFPSYKIMLSNNMILDFRRPCNMPFFFFYQIPLDKEKFDPQRDFYKGELIPIDDIPDKEKEEVAVEAVYTPKAYVVSMSKRYSLRHFPSFLSFRSFDDHLS